VNLLFREQSRYGQRSVLINNRFMRVVTLANADGCCQVYTSQFNDDINRHRAGVSVRMILPEASRNYRSQNIYCTVNIAISVNIHYY
jgi:hypothetical protein